MNTIFGPYLYSWLALIALYILSFAVMHSPAPKALARGHNGQLSTSLMQFLVFTAIVIFAYASAAAARLSDPQQGALSDLSKIPLNLLILMGLSVTTATGSKGITISYLQQNKIPADDQSNLTSDREGSTDLAKVQMLMWTLVTAVAYLTILTHFITEKLWVQSGMALPDVDGALLVLMGVSQGGYIGHKLVSTTPLIPIIERIVPSQAKANDEAKILGGFFGAKNGNSIIITSKGLEDFVAADCILDWTETEIRIRVPPKFAPSGGGTPIEYYVYVRTGTGSSNSSKLTILASPPPTP